MRALYQPFKNSIKTDQNSNEKLLYVVKLDFMQFFFFRSRCDYSISIEVPFIYVSDRLSLCKCVYI